MLPIQLLEHLQLLLNFAKDPAHRLTARENLAAAKELVNTAHTLGAIDGDEYRSLRLLCAGATLIVDNAELERAQAAVSLVVPKTYTSFADGVRAVQVLP